MKCLHISNDFSNSKVHRNLYTRLDRLGLEQIVFNPVRQNTRIGNNNIDFETTDSTIIYSKKMKRFHRILFRDKIRFLFRDLESQYDLKQIDIVHATTLFSDGAIALKIYKKYQIPYIVAIRGTDVSLFLKYRPDLSILLKDILQNARCIIFLGEALKRQFFKKVYVKMLIPDLSYKLKVINNGIDDFWLENLASKKKISPEKILYIGRFDYNKNTVGLIDGILKLKSDYPNLKLELVGKGGEYEEEIIKRSKMHDFITYHGPVYDKKKLKEIYRANHIFAMPSHSETFGLVYLEALSQGLPVLCSENQGIDGLFENKVGEFVDPKSVESIAAGLQRMIADYPSFDLGIIDFSAFNWESISQTYFKIYNDACNA